MVLFTGVILWCLFLWLVRDDDEDEDAGGAEVEAHRSETDGQNPR
jgi:hypothetical protein